MTYIRVTCQCCGAGALVRPAQVLLLADPDQTSGVYLFQCSRCERLTVRFAEAGDVQLLIAAGASAGEDEGQTTGGQPAVRAEARPPFTPDDLLYFHLLLADDDWLPRPAGSIRPPLPG